VPIVNYHQGQFSGTYTPGGGTATEIRIKWSVTQGGPYSNTSTVTYATSFTKALSQVFSQDGVYYCVATAANSDGECSPSPEIVADVRTGLGLIALVIRRP
jgi:hypothetical protein